MKSVELEGDPILQIFLFLACPEINYSYLLDKVCLTVLLVGIGHKFTANEKVYQYPKYHLSLFHYQ